MAEAIAAETDPSGQTADRSMRRIVIEFFGDRIAVVTLNRPEKANAVDAVMTEELQSAVHALEADERVDVVVLAAAGSVRFCAGADLAVVLAGEQAALFPADGGFAGFVRARRTKPWIAAVDGAALAGGFEIVLACDLVIATPRATFGLPEVRWGLVAAAGGVQRLPRRVPPSIAREMILTGAAISAEAALHHGLVNRIVPPAELMSAAHAMAKVIAANAGGAVRASVGLIRRVLDDENPEIWADTETIGHRLAGGGEAATRIGAFVNRTSRTAP